MSAARAPPHKWAVGQECYARYREDDLVYKAMILEVTGATCTVVFLDYGNHQPATPADWIFTELPSGDAGAQTLSGDELAVEDDTVATQPHMGLNVVPPGALASVDQLDSLIESRADEQACLSPPPPPPPPAAATPPADVDTDSPSGAPVPPPPPPPGVRQERSRSRLEMAAHLLGVSVAAPPEPVPATSSEAGPFFGIELADLRARDGTAIPPVLVLAANELRKRSEQEGIFRIPGRAQVVSQLVDAADRGGDVELHEKDTPDIASFLKKFFALLPAPVIPGDLVDRFGESRSDPKALCLELRQIVDQVLPEERAEVLNFMLQLLHDISLKSDLNKMTSKNLATVFLPALFFSVQSDNTSPEEIMKMAVLGKTVSATLAFMIENPSLDPERIETSKTVAAKGPATIAISSSPMLQRKAISPVIKSGSPSPVAAKRGSRRGSSSRARADSDSLIPQTPSSGKLSAESVLAAMRLAKTRIVRRAGTFAADAATWTGKRGWLTMSKKRYWFLVVNDWLYWFKDAHDDLGGASLAHALSTFLGNLWIARCNVVMRERELEILQPSGANIVLVSDTEPDCEEWMAALVEISVAGFPLPLHITAEMFAREEWVTVKDQNLFACIDMERGLLLLCRDETRGKVVRSVALHAATVAKGTAKSGQAAFVVADVHGKVVINAHNGGAAQDWVTQLKSAIVVAWARRFEPDTVKMAPKQ